MLDRSPDQDAFHVVIQGDRRTQPYCLPVKRNQAAVDVCAL